MKRIIFFVITSVMFNQTCFGGGETPKNQIKLPYKVQGFSVENVDTIPVKLTFQMRDDGFGGPCALREMETILHPGEKNCLPVAKVKGNYRIICSFYQNNFFVTSYAKNFDSHFKHIVALHRNQS